MTKKHTGLLAILALVAALGLWLFPPVNTPKTSLSEDPDTLARGEYLVHAAGCVGCHISDEGSGALGGGQALKSEFGTFYVPNITPDRDSGIGDWDAEDLIAAIKHGRSPGGQYYFPAFPYRSYAGMTDDDAVAIASWLMAQASVFSPTPSHELDVPIWLARLAMGPWNRLADFKTPDFVENGDEQVQRGAYLARNLGHCSECHTPRDRFGIRDSTREFEGAALVDGEAEAINPEALQYWSEGDLAFFLLMGLKPDDEYVGGEMAKVIKHSTSSLTQADRNALAAFFIRGQE